MIRLAFFLACGQLICCGLLNRLVACIPSRETAGQRRQSSENDGDRLLRRRWIRYAIHGAGGLQPRLRYADVGLRSEHRYQGGRW